MKAKLAIAFLLTSALVFGQLQWQKGGNNFIPFASPPTIGTSGAWNSPLKVITFGVQRMHIDNGNGFVAIGTAFSIPTSLLHLNDNGNALGNLFQTDGLAANNNIWQMTSTSGGAFNVGIPANTQDVEFNLLGFGNYTFNTPGLTRSRGFVIRAL